MTSGQLAWMIRRHGIEMTHLSGGSHIGAILSVADIIAVLYAEVMHYDAALPDWDERDRFILSKGHAGAAIYAALAETGFFDVSELMTHYRNGSRLSGHVSHHLPGVDFSTGSLGHGISAGAGMAYAAKKDGKSHKVYVVLGDGECDEGSVWEAALFANHFRLNNLIVIIDHNHMQSLDFQENTLEMEDFGAKWRAFGWNVIETNGNDHDALKKSFHLLCDPSDNDHRPTVIIADTIKGYGVSFMQNDIFGIIGSLMPDGSMIVLLQSCISQNRRVLQIPIHRTELHTLYCRMRRTISVTTIPSLLHGIQAIRRK